MPDTSDKILHFPNLDEEKEKNYNLKKDLLDLILERDELAYYQGRDIEKSYKDIFADLEYQVYQNQYLALRIRRKFELIQDKFNSQAEINMAKIESQLDREFESHKKILANRADRVHESKTGPHSPDPGQSIHQDLRTSYKNLIKNLHPAFKPRPSAKERQIFDSAVQAYAESDLDRLRALNLEMARVLVAEKQIQTRDYLILENLSLEDFIGNLKEEIIQLKNSYPYRLKAYLEDPDLKKKHTKGLEHTLVYYRDLVEVYKSRIRQILDLSMK